MHECASHDPDGEVWAPACSAGSLIPIEPFPDTELRVFNNTIHRLPDGIIGMP
jgi:hypothetical protein